ncbi:hypothetical protein PVAND_014349 [Polypedilum vanderplanki]|uniref:Uncharacterized protein n=1 Tax=Polypedilum vanderplanki TaxID=319348 RepID=A0A9J6CSU1_POLVA|nr:hypothetical protein PVAND_014349 [Polypedilum vanderplanki]
MRLSTRSATRILLILSFYFLNAYAVINQEAQRREAPSPLQNQYGPPHPQRPSLNQQKRIQAMQRLIAVMRNGGYDSQARVVNRPIPIHNIPPQKVYGPPVTGQPILTNSNQGYSSSSGSLHSFTHNHNPEVRCDGWIPIPGKSVPNLASASGSASTSGNIDTSYGPPNHNSINSGSLSTLIVVPEIDTSLGIPPPVNPQSSYGVPATVSGIAHSSSSSISAVDSSYSVSQQPVIAPIVPHKEYGVPVAFNGNAHSSSSSISAVDSNYNVPQPPAPSLIVPHKEYGIPETFSGNAASIQTPHINNEYGPPIIGTGHASSATAIGSIDTSFVPPPLAQPAPVIENEYGAPAISSHGSSSSGNLFSNIETSYGVPQSNHFGAIDSYAPPPSGLPSIIHSENAHHSSGDEYQQIQSVETELQLPEINSGGQFNNNNAIGFVSSSLGVSGNSEVIKSHAIHESHTSELFCPPVDSYAPGNYNPSFLNQQQQQRRPPPIRPQRPIPLLQPQRQSQSQYIPPVPMKLDLFSSFNSYSNSGSSGVATSSSTFSLQNNELRNVHVIHDCGKGHLPAQSYGTPLAPPLTQYIPPSESHSAVLSTSYEVPAQNFEVPQHNSVDFNSPANSYGPPASGPASSSLDVIGLESRGNSVIVEPQTAESNDAPKVELPGLSSGLSNSGLDFISATKSHTLVLPTSQSGPTRNFQLNIQSSHSDQSDNRVDLPNHQQILADGLLNSILNAIEQPSPTVPQVSEDPEQEHNEAKKFLESKAGQEVLAEKKEH